MSEMIDGYTAAKIKAFWSLPNLSTSLSPHIVQQQVDFLLEQLAQKDKKIEAYEAALHGIASWKEGKIVNGSFDEPYSAEKAREVLSKYAVKK